MGKEKRNGRTTIVSENETGITEATDTAATLTAGMPGESIPSGNSEVPEETTPAAIRKDRSNPPVYGIVGVKPDDAGMDLLATFPTRNQMAKNLPMVKRMVSRSYDSLEYVKIKYIDMSEFE